MVSRTVSNICKVIVALCMLAVVSACAVRDKPHPDTIILQQPLAGRSLIYFLRTPHDSGPLVVETNGKHLVKLPPETYAALSLPPGRYRFLTTGGLFSSGEVAEPLEVTLKEGERVFYHVSGIDEKRIGLTGVINVQGAGAVPLLGRESVVRNRMWKACTELDARGLITIARQVEPE
jgi:hypothetical protein